MEGIYSDLSESWKEIIINMKVNIWNLFSERIYVIKIRNLILVFLRVKVFCCF